MTIFVLMCFDKKNALAERMAVREAHLAYIGEHLERVKLAGPLLDEAGEMAGSLILYEAETLAEVEAFNAADPYKTAGVFERVEISAMKITRGALA
ncbi:MAG: hypothetical protein B7Z13_01095 [Caulobacterales bacterium 32-67-6]|jgi:uncharacterized protein YciI|nr:MAG: hypothetical protein B7Z13_01095 [Caulobacterales bacterium 32-67-6]